MTDHESDLRNRAAAQAEADRIRILREEITSGEVEPVLALTPEQRQRFEEWSRAKLASLAQRFDVDTIVSQKRVSTGMRIASTLGGLAVCAAVVLFFMRYWGFLHTWAQLTILILTPMALLTGTEVMARRERTKYFTGLLALVALVSFVLNLSVVGSIFNIVPTERALLAWGLLAMVLAYRYGLHLMLALGLLLLISYVAAAFTTQMHHVWLDFAGRPELFLLLGAVVFVLPLVITRFNFAGFDAIYRLIGMLTFFIAILSLAEWGVPSYLPWSIHNVEQFYEFAGLILAALAIWLGIARNWNEAVNIGACFFAIFLLTRLYHWWWDWMPKYLFFAVIGMLGIGFVIAFRRLRVMMIRRDDEVIA